MKNDFKSQYLGWWYFWCTLSSFKLLLYSPLPCTKKRAKKNSQVSRALSAPPLAPPEPPRGQSKEAIIWWMVRRGGHAEAKVSWGGGGYLVSWVCEKSCLRFWSKYLAVSVSWDTFFPRPQAPWVHEVCAAVSIVWEQKNYLKLIECKLLRSFISELIQGPRRSPSNMFMIL